MLSGPNECATVRPRGRSVCVRFVDQVNAFVRRLIIYSKMYSYKPLAPVTKETDDTSSIWQQVIKRPKTITAAAAITGLDLHPLTSELLVTCTRKVDLFDASLQSKRSLYSVSPSPKYSACFRPKDGQLIAVGQGSGVISVYRSGKGNLLRELKGHQKATKCVIFADEFHVLSCSEDGKAKEWDLGSASALNEWDHGSNAITCVTLAQEANYFATGASDGILRLWDRRASTPMHTLTASSSSMIGSVISRRSLIFASTDRSIFAYDLRTGRQLISLPNVHADVINSMAILNDDLISCSTDGMVKIFDKDTLNEVHQMKHPQTNIQHVTTNGKTLVVGSFDGSVFVHSLRTDLLLQPEKLKVKKKRKLRQFDEYLRRGDHGKALESALRDKPVYTVALLQELIRRRKLSASIVGLDTTPLIDFIVENISDHNFTRTLIDVISVLVEVLSRQMSHDEKARTSISRLHAAVKDEAKLITQMKRLSGQLQLLQKAHQ